jgi:hypothetical protein
MKALRSRCKKRCPTRPVLHRGKYGGTGQKADNSALLSHLAQLDRPLREARKDLRREARSQALKDSDPRQPARGLRAKGRSRLSTD